MEGAQSTLSWWSNVFTLRLFIPARVGAQGSEGIESKLKSSEAQTSSVSSSSSTHLGEQEQQGQHQGSQAAPHTPAAKSGWWQQPPRPRPRAMKRGRRQEEWRGGGGGGGGAKVPTCPRKITHEGGEGGRKDGSREKEGGETEKQVRNTEVNIWRSLVRSRKQQLEDGSSMLAWGGEGEAHEDNRR